MVSHHGHSEDAVTRKWGAENGHRHLGVQVPLCERKHHTLNMVQTRKRLRTGTLHGHHGADGARRHGAASLFSWPESHWFWELARPKATHTIEKEKPVQWRNNSHVAPVWTHCTSAHTDTHSSAASTLIFVVLPASSPHWAR